MNACYTDPPFIQKVNISFHLSFLQLGFVQPSTPAICFTWWFMDLGLYNGCTIIMAWNSAHRYLLIYHDRIFFNKKQGFIFHYLPRIILLLYIFLFYIIAICFPPCVNTYDYTLLVCK